MIFIKIGGSVFSDKRGELENFRMDVVEEIVRELVEFYFDEKFVIVYGGGSFGYYYVKEYFIREGFFGSWGIDSWRRFGFLLIY